MKHVYRNCTTALIRRARGLRCSLLLIAMLMFLAQCGRSDQFGAVTTPQPAYPVSESTPASAYPFGDGAYPLPSALPTSLSPTDSGIIIDYFQGEIGVVIDQTGKVVNILPNSPAQQSGMRVGDVITGVEGQAVGEQFLTVRAMLRFGVQTKLEIQRQGENTTIIVTPVIHAQPTPAPAQPSPTLLPDSYIYL